MMFERPLTDGRIALLNLSAQIDSLEQEAGLGQAPVAARAGLVEFLLLRGMIVSRIADYERAEEIAEQLVGEAPDDASALIARAHTRSCFHRFSDALADIDRAERHSLDAETGNGERAAIFQAIGRYDEALVMRQAAAARRTSFENVAALVGLHAERGEAEAAERRHGESRGRYRGVSPLPLALLEFQLGLMWINQDGLDRARAAFAAALRLVPNYAPAQGHLAEVEAELGETDSATDRLQVLALSSDDPDYAAQLARILGEAGHYCEARHWSRRAAARFDELLAIRPGAFADHAAEFWLAAGGDPRKALLFAKMNAKIRNTPHARRLLARAIAANVQSPPRASIRSPMMIEVVQAFDRSPIARLESDDAAALDRKIEAARRVFADRRSWLKPHRRIEILRKLAVLMESKREHLGIQIAREGGKPLTDALVETDRAIDGVRSAAEELRVIAGREIPMGLTPASLDRRAFTILEPIGAVAAISAFNHPLNLIVHQVVPAVATGCPVIIKPANPTPLSCLDLVGLLHEAGLPPDHCQVFLAETNELAEALATDPRVAFVSFIGSARVGWHIRSKLPPGTRCALEHGGAAPVIIDRSADLDRVIGPLTKGGYYHAGQVCVSVQRIYVHAELEREFIARFAASVEALKVGDPLLPETEVGPLILPHEADRVSAWTDEAVSAGAKRIGGGRINSTTLAPSIIVNPPADAKVSTLEVFGPITCVYPFTRLDDAVVAANSLPVAFQASVFTEDLRTAFDAAERLDASAVMVNDHTAFRTDWMPFAGRRASGYGIGGIPWTMREMSEQKMIVFRT